MPNTYVPAGFNGDLKGGGVQLVCIPCYDKRVEKLGLTGARLSGIEMYSKDAYNALQAKLTHGLTVDTKGQEFWDSRTSKWGNRTITCPECGGILCYPEGAEW